MKRLSIIALAVTSLTACSCFQTKPDLPAVSDGNTKVEVDARLLEDCPEVTKLSGAKDIQNKDFTEQLLKDYAKCATGKKDLNAVARKAFNLEKK